MELDLANKETDQARNRKDNLLIMLRERRILVLDVAGLETYRQLYEPNAESQIDSKTIKRSVEQLVGEGAVRQFSVQKLVNNKITSKMCLILPEISMDSEEVKTFIERLRVPTQATPVLRLAYEDRREVNVVRLNTSTEPRNPQFSQEQFLRKLKYGYNPARFARAGLMHQFLVAHRLKAISLDPRKALGDYHFDIAWIYKDMPVSLYLQAFGVMKESAELQALLEAKSNLNFTLDGVPPSISAKSFPIGQSFHRRANQCFQTLEKLGLVRLIYHQSGATPIQFPSVIVVHADGAIKDYKEVEPQERYRIGFDTIEETIRFWDDLQTLSLTKESTEANPRNISLGPRDTSLLESSLRNINCTRNWQTSLRMTSATKEYLDSFCDTESGSTPHITLSANITKDWKKGHACKA